MGYRIDEIRAADPELQARVKQALAEAENLRQQGRCQEGLDLLSDVLAFGIMRADIHYRMGNLYFDLGDLDSAERAYRKAIECNPEHVNAHHNLAVVCKRKGKLDEAVRLRRRAFALEMKHPPKPPQGADEDNTKRLSPVRVGASIWLIIGIGIALLLFLRH
ncbi:MAG TPA: tetratricopeptide repeat protein [Firmicutes bacterium]|nr:tetratricopeptide repeat protein [Bacillota bacterium]HHY97365.1 tetratricopeptide repeat protein [Bacillota bacterium]